MTEALRGSDAVISEPARITIFAEGERDNKALLMVSGENLFTTMANRFKNDYDDTTSALRMFDLKTNSKIGEEIIKEYSQGRLIENNAEAREEFLVASSFVEVIHSKQSREISIGIVLPEEAKLRAPTFLGAMIAEADYVAVGTDDPNRIPKVFTKFIGRLMRNGGYSVKDALKYISEPKVKKEMRIGVA